MYVVHRARFIPLNQTLKHPVRSEEGLTWSADVWQVYELLIAEVSFAAAKEHLRTLLRCDTLLTAGDNRFKSLHLKLCR